MPQQVRSIELVARILDAASDLVLGQGPDAITTRAVAARADVPVASLYQYFADRDDILLALVERDVAEMDAQVATDLAAVPRLSIGTLVEATMRAFVKVYHRRQAFVVIWLRGRTNPAIDSFCRAHNKRIAESLFAFARDAGLLGSEVDLMHAELAVEVGDRVFQLAFEHDLRGDEAVIDEGIELVRGYLERRAGAAAPGGAPT